MRRMLPRTLSRPLAHQLRPLGVAKRCQATTATTANTTTTSEVDQSSVSSSSTASGQATTTQEKNPHMHWDKIQLLPLVKPPPPAKSSRMAQLPLSNPSLLRTSPQEVKRRRTEHPPHPRLSVTPLTDPELLEEGNSKRMKLIMEREFDRWRARGLFPGDEVVARSHYLDTLRTWRCRIRGEITEAFNSGRGEWAYKWLNVSKEYHFLKAAQDRGVQLPNEPLLKPLEVREAILVHKDLVTKEDLIPSMVQERFLCTVEEFDFESHERADLLKLGVIDLNTIEEKLKNDTGLTERTRRRITGYQIYLPNLIIRLMRNHTPPGEPYDPFIATFRIPIPMTKNDLRSYLKSVYDLDVTFIRTDIHLGKVIRNRKSARLERQKGSSKNYKRAVVGLTQPFHYPDDLDELRALGRATGRGDELYENRLTTLDQYYFLRENQQRRQELMQKIYKRARRHRSKGQGNMAVTIQSIMSRRLEREQLLESEARKYRARATNRHSGNEGISQVVSDTMGADMTTKQKSEAEAYMKKGSD